MTAARSHTGDVMDAPPEGNEISDETSQSASFGIPIVVLDSICQAAPNGGCIAGAARNSMSPARANVAAKASLTSAVSPLVVLSCLGQPYVCILSEENNYATPPAAN